MDRLSTKRRSWLMSRVRGKDTRPEIMVRTVAHGLGLRYRLHQESLPGRPDLVFKKHNIVIFVHGCFWHRHPGCRKAGFPKSNVEFWREKFERTIKRDARTMKSLRESGWKVEVVWECETKNVDQVREKLIGMFELRSS